MKTASASLSKGPYVSLWLEAREGRISVRTKLFIKPVIVILALNRQSYNGEELLILNCEMIQGIHNLIDCDIFFLIFRYSPAAIDLY